MSGTRAGALKGWETRRLMHRPTKRNEAKQGKRLKPVAQLTESEVYAERYAPADISNYKRREAVQARFDRLETKRHQDKERTKERERTTRERERVQHNKQQSRADKPAAKAPVKRASDQAEKARLHYWKVYDQWRAGRATHAQVQAADDAYHAASQHSLDALHAYYAKYGVHYTP